jgi:formate dehydrogenase subunit gamma
MSQLATGKREWSSDTARAILESKASNLILPNLQIIQNEFGYIPHEAIELVAEVCNVSKADVHGVMTYYTDLRDVPAAKVAVKLCIAEACQANGVREFTPACENALGVKLNQHNPAGVELEGVYCLGNCALGPTAFINQNLYGRLTIAKLKEVVNAELEIQ